MKHLEPGVLMRRPSSIPPSPHKGDPLLDRMTSLPQRKTVSGIWRPETAQQPLPRIIFSVRNTFAAADIMLATTSLYCKRQDGNVTQKEAVRTLERSFRSLDDGTKAHLESITEELANSAIRLVEADGGRMELLRKGLAEAARLGHYMGTDIIMHRKDSRFSDKDTGPVTEAMFLASANILALAGRKGTGIIDDAFLAIDGVVSWMGTETCMELMDTITMADAKGTMMGVIQEAKIYTNNESGLYRALDVKRREMRKH